MWIDNGGQFNSMCNHIRSQFNIRGIIIYKSNAFSQAGWPIGRDAALNDNEAKP